MNRPRTRPTTLYRLVPEVRGSREEMFDAYNAYISARALDEMDADLQFLDMSASPAIWIGVQAETGTADWCGDASVTTGLEVIGIPAA